AGRRSACGRGDDTICPKLAATLAQAEDAAGESHPVTPMTQPSTPKAGQPALRPRAPASRQPPSLPQPAGQAAVRQRHRRRRWLATAGYVALALACVLAGSITFLLVAAPIDVLREQLVQPGQARTG